MSITHFPCSHWKLYSIWALPVHRLQEMAQSRLRSALCFQILFIIAFLVCLLFFFFFLNENWGVLAASIDSQSGKGQQGAECSSPADMLLVILREIHLPTGRETLSRHDVPRITNCCQFRKNWLYLMWFPIKLWDACWNVKQNVSSAEFLLTYRENPHKDSTDCIFNRLTNYLLID